MIRGIITGLLAGGLLSLLALVAAVALLPPPERPQPALPRPAVPSASTAPPAAADTPAGVTRAARAPNAAAAPPASSAPPAGGPPAVAGGPGAAPVRAVAAPPEEEVARPRLAGPAEAVRPVAILDRPARGSSTRSAPEVSGTTAPGRAAAPVRTAVSPPEEAAPSTLAGPADGVRPVVAMEQPSQTAAHPVPEVSGTAAPSPAAAPPPGAPDVRAGVAADLPGGAARPARPDPDALDLP